MRNARKTLLLVFVIAAAGCVAAPGLGPASAAYEAIVEDQRIDISESGSGAGKWDGPDLSVQYHYAMGPGGMTIWGTINFPDSLRYGFGLLNFFTAGIIFGNAEGRVTGSNNLVSTRQSGFDDWEVKFSRSIPLPPGTATFAFTYNGELMEVGGGGRHGRGGGGANPTKIWHTPVRRASIPQQGMK